MNEDQIKRLAAEALDAAILLIQQRLGVNTGDAAGVFFSDDIALDALADYVRLELSLAEDNKPS